MWRVVQEREGGHTQTFLTFLFPPEHWCHCIIIWVGLKEWNPVQNVWVHFYVLLRKFIQCDCSVARAVKHLNPWLKKGNTLTDVCLLLSLRPCFNNKPLFLLLGCSRKKKNERSNKAVRQISGARRQCNSNDRFLMWQERLTGKCLRSKRTPDGMKTVYWSMEVLLNWIEGGFKVGVLSASSKQQQPKKKPHTILSPGIALDQSLYQGDFVVVVVFCLFICFFCHSTTPEKNFKVKSSVITCTVQKEKANWFGLSFFYCLPLFSHPHPPHPPS